jgi:SH3-like domain-containing protein
MCLLVGASGCSRLRPKPATQYVYVTAKETFLRDRVAAVSNRTATVENGEKLEVLDHGRRFFKVQTPKGEQGWIDDKVVATQAVFDQFEQLKQENKDTPAVASAVVRDDVYLHAAPGREAEKFFRLAEGDKLKLLKRATLPKPLPPGMRAAVRPVETSAGGKVKGSVTEPPIPAAPVMEDWWLVRDSKGDTGWLYSRMMDVDAPDSIVRYSEGQRVVGAYVLTTVNDPEASQDNSGQSNGEIPEYVTVMSPYKAGLPYDFDQVRVFTWNVKKHRYETAFREHDIEGYLPVEIEQKTNPYEKDALGAQALPSFTYHVLSADSPAPAPDPKTGVIKPGKTVAKTYRLEGNITKRMIAPGVQAPAEAHPVVEEKKDAKKKKK